MFLRAVFLVLSATLSLSFPAPLAARDDAVSLLAAADPGDGARLFLRCKACHTSDKGGRHRLGPNLWDVVGRKRAAAPGFRYSTGFRRLGGVWDYAALDAFLETPRGIAPGTRMAFPGLKNARQRAAVIAYLRTLSDRPVPLPESAASTPAPRPATDDEPEDFGGLPPGEGREETHAICGACHSLRLVTQQGLDADRWDALIDWMTEKQGMAELEKDERHRIVSYLAAEFGPDRRSLRRADPMRPAMPAMPTMAPPPMAPAMPPPP